MFDVVTLGELLIDFTPAGLSVNGNALFEENPGGAPANVAAALAKWGRRAAFVGKVGNDRFGRFLRDILQGANVDTSSLLMTDDVHTTLAFVHLASGGDRSFSFYRRPGADMMLRQEEIKRDLVASARIFHFGSVSMTHEPARSATLAAVDCARGHGVFVSFDPNLRPPLWDDLDEARRVILDALPKVDLCKLSAEELLFLTSTSDLEKGSASLRDKYEIPMIFVTLGPRGCFYRLDGRYGVLPTYDVPVVDTNGAGDGFLAGILLYLLESGHAHDGLSDDDIRDMVDTANAAGALTTKGHGAIPALPTREEIIACRGSVPKLVSAGGG